MKEKPVFNEWDTGLIWGPEHNDCGRVTVIGRGGDPFDSNASYDHFEVVYHFHFGPLAGTDEPLAKFDTLEDAESFGWCFSRLWNQNVYEERAERIRNAKPPKIDWDEIRRLRDKHLPKRTIGYVIGDSVAVGTANSDSAAEGQNVESSRREK